MELLKELFASPVGILSFITIAFVIVIATFLFFWVKKQADQAPKNRFTCCISFLLMCVCLGCDRGHTLFLSATGHLKSRLSTVIFQTAC